MIFELVLIVVSVFAGAIASIVGLPCVEAMERRLT